LLDGFAVSTTSNGMQKTAKGLTVNKDKNQLTMQINQHAATAAKEITMSKVKIVCATRSEIYIEECD